MSGRVFDAPMEQKGPIPAYRIVEQEGPFKREVCTFDEKTKRIVKHEAISDVIYVVFFPRGHSQAYHSLEALENAGFGEMVPLIRTGDGESEVNKEHIVPTVKVPIEKAKN